MRIFIVGSGRTGTHLLSDIISSNSNIDVIGEDNDLFYPTVDYCMENVNSTNETYKRLLQLLIEKDNYVCKFHPLLWLTENLNKDIDNTLFIGTKILALIKIWSNIL